MRCTLAGETCCVLTHLLEKLLAAVKQAVISDLTQPTHFSYLALFLPLLLLTMHLRRAPPSSLRNFLATAFRKDIYLSASARTDYQVYLGMLIFAACFPWRVFAWLQAHCATIVAASLSVLMGAHALPPSPAAKLLFIAVSFLLMDFAYYVSHYALHRIPVLWEFHAVHHSAESLNVVTTYRLNPVESLATVVSISLFVGLFAGVYRFLFGAQSSLVIAAIPPLLYVPFEIFNLFKHHHVPMSFGPVISRFIASPDLHHVHHSTASEHVDRNFGHFLSIWDWMFGTLVVPAIPQKLEYGLTYGIDGRPAAEYRSLLDCFGHPFLRAARLLFHSRKAMPLPPVTAIVPGTNPNG